MSRFQKWAVITFIIFETLWFVFYHMQVFSVKVAFLAIVLCFALSLLFVVENRKFSMQKILLSLALLFTCIADIFLVLLDKESVYVVGVFLFVIVQIIYFLLIHKNDERKKIITSIAVRLIVFFCLMIIIFAIFGGDSILTENFFLAFLALFYFVNLLFNIVFSVKNFIRNYLLPIGLFLLMLCDIIIGLSFLEIIPSTEVEICWTFYIPSQAFLALSFVPVGTILLSILKAKTIQNKAKQTKLHEFRK